MKALYALLGVVAYSKNLNLRAPNDQKRCVCFRAYSCVIYAVTKLRFI